MFYVVFMADTIYKIVNKTLLDLIVFENINTLTSYVPVYVMVNSSVELVVLVMHAFQTRDGDTACWMIDGRGHSL